MVQIEEKIDDAWVVIHNTSPIASTVAADTAVSAAGPAAAPADGTAAAAAEPCPIDPAVCTAAPSADAAANPAVAAVGPAATTDAHLWLHVNRHLNSPWPRSQYEQVFGRLSPEPGATFGTHFWIGMESVWASYPHRWWADDSERIACRVAIPADFSRANMMMPKSEANKPSGKLYACYAWKDCAHGSEAADCWWFACQWLLMKNSRPWTCVSEWLVLPEHH